MSVIGIIPVRIKSSRLPNKAMKIIEGMPMIGHVYYRCKLSRSLNDIYIATCDLIIKKYAESIGAKVIMTSQNHKRATDRIYEAFCKISKDKRNKIKKIVMVQGDEPMLNPLMIDDVSKAMSSKEILITNLFTELKKKNEIIDKNRVKVVVDKDNYAIYFSRKAIPNKINKNQIQYLKQGNIFCFRQEYLKKFTKIKPSNLEIAESVDMNRFIEKRIKIKMVKSNFYTVNVDTIKDLNLVRKKIKKDKFLKLYI